MRLRAGLGILLAGALLAGCASGQSRELARYYDPRGLFSADLPAVNSVAVTPARRGQGGSSVLSGVVASPPQPSPSASSALGGGFGALAQQQPAGDQTLYQVLVVSTDAFDSVESMDLYFLTGDPAVDVREDRPITVGRTAGRLIVGDITQAGSVRASIAAAFTLGTHDVGYIVAAVFPPGDWDRERSDFARVVASLSPDVPLGLSSFPLSTG
jgi:hypothetical protein